MQARVCRWSLALWFTSVFGVMCFFGIWAAICLILSSCVITAYATVVLLIWETAAPAVAFLLSVLLLVPALYVTLLLCDWLL
jgi:hypothetical protein